MSKKFVRILIVAIVLIGVVFGGLYGLKGTSDDQGPVADDATFAVRRGALTISVSEAGTIQAREQVVIKNEVEGRTTILSLVKEGTRVKQGDLLIELDASRLQDELIDHQIRVQNSEAAFIRARENLAVTRNQAGSDVEKARLEAQFAKEDLKKYREGEYPQQLKESEAKITIRKEELRRAEEKLEWSRVLYKEKYIPQTELQADELAAQKAQLDLELAETDLNLLEDYTHKRQLDELTSQVRQTDMALERAERKASADVVQAEAELRAKDSEYQREQSKLAKIEAQIEKTKIYAPIDGLAVYATSAQANWRGNAEPLAEGQEIRERQELIYLPATGSVKAEIKVHESALDKVSVDLPVEIAVDALPGKTYRGTVANIAPLPDAVSVWLNPDLKVYNTDIYLESSSGELRTGMSCRAEILVERIEDAVYVPVQSVVRRDGRPVVFLVENGRSVVHDVVLGRDNNRMVQILEGLSAGQRVLLAPPLQGEGQVAES